MKIGLLVTMLLAAAVEILFPLALGLWIARRWRAPWKLFLYGAIVFLVFQEFTRIPLISIAQPAVADLVNRSPWYKYAWIVVLALSAGLFEEGGRYLGYRFLWKNVAKNWPHALMYGAGHGGAESMLLVGLTLLLQAVSFIYIFQVDPATLPADQSLVVYQARESFALLPWWVPLLSALERLLAMALQVAFSVLVLQVFTRGRFYWWWLALAYHALADLVVMLAADRLGTVLAQWPATLVTEAIVVPLALFGLWIIWRLRPRDTAGVDAPAGLVSC